MTSLSLNIFFDPKGEQVKSNSDGTRLKGVTHTIEGAGWTSNLFNPKEVLEGFIDLTPSLDNWDSLKNYDVIVLTDRYIDTPYTYQEIQNVVTFVREGKGLWCMANHAGFNGGPTPHGEPEPQNNHVASDSAIASTFFTSYQAAAYQSQTPSKTPTCKPPETVPVLLQTLRRHPIIRGIRNVPLVTVKSDGITVEVDPSNTNPQPIETIETRSFCGVYPNPFTTPIAYLTGINKEINSNPNPRVINCQTGEPIETAIGTDPQAVWAVAIDSTTIGGSYPSPTREGRVVIGGDAGWLGDTTSCNPGLGQFQNADNPQYFLNTLAWLSGQFD